MDEDRHNGSRGEDCSADKIRSLLANWRSRADGIGKFFIFSPPWNQLWDTLWAEYEDLESSRKRTHVESRQWQTELESSRPVYDKLRSEIALLTSTDDWKQCPLWVALEHFIGSESSNRECSWSMALRNWRLFENITGGDLSQNQFWMSLSKSQQVSWNLLQDWWVSRYQDPSLSKAVQNAIEVAVSFEAPGYSYEVSGMLNKAKIDTSLYHSWHFDLFRREFDPSVWEPYLKNIFLPRLASTRQSALRHAHAQRIAYSFYTNDLAEDRHLQRTGSPYTQNVQDATPWLPKIDRRHARPYYLWDVTNDRTIVVDDLTEVPEYLCISHTWGRWRKDPTIQMSGVPWPVPQNTRFNVRHLPSHFKCIKPRPNYVWFDLFCIPQDGSARQAEEIRRQAGIFQSASTCVAWINEIEGWEMLSSTLNWLSAQYLHLTTISGVYRTDEWLATAANPAQQPIELMNSSRKQQLPADWFSSLWTLQEAVICPHLIIADRDWRIVVDGVGVPVPFDTLLSFVTNVSGFANIPKPVDMSFANPSSYETQIQRHEDWAWGAFLNWPQGPVDLRVLCDLTFMDRAILSSTPTTLLHVASLRQSTDSRAPAIMSAIGCTDWHINANIRDRSPLVFKAYPLSFVREVSRKLGASFFQSVTPDYRTYPRLLYNLIRKSEGSLIPFYKLRAPGENRFADLGGIPELPRTNPVDHPAVSSWQVQADASVRIQNAGVLAGTGRPAQPDIQCDIWIDLKIVKNGKNHKEKRDRSYSGTVNDWLAQVRKDLCTYLVILYEDSGLRHGVVLQSSRKLFFFTKRLIKTGNFTTRAQLDIPSEKVNWVVI